MIYMIPMELQRVLPATPLMQLQTYVRDLFMSHQQLTIQALQIIQSSPTARLPRTSQIVLILHCLLIPV